MSHHFQQQSLRLTQLVQDFHPVLRRRAVTSIRTSFPTFFSSDTQNNLVSMNESQRLISEHFSRINQIIDLVDDHIRRRIQLYENEVVNVVQKQIQQMREQTQKVVTQFNSMIQQKNKQNQIWSLNNQLDYFKSEAKKLFQSNKIFKKQNAQLKQKFKEYEWQLQNRQVIMQKLLYKYQKQKYHKEKLKTMMDEQFQNIQNQASTKRKQSKPQIMEFSLKQDVFHYEDIPQLKLNSIKPIVNIKELRKVSPIPEKLDETQKLIPQNKDNSLLIIDYQEESQISKIDFKGKSISIQQPKPEMKDQQSQVNIYLSEHSYKSIFEKKINMKKIVKKTQQIAIQTYKIQNPQVIKRDNQTRISCPKRSKQINLTKHGFHVNEAPTQQTHYRSSSSNFSSTRKQNLYNFKDSKQKRLVTQNNFNKISNEEFQIKLTTTKPNKGHNKLYYKMANRFQRNKIFDKAYDKSKLSQSVQK